MAEKPSYRIPVNADIVTDLTPQLGGHLDGQDTYRIVNLLGLEMTAFAELTLDTDGIIAVTQMLHTVDTFEGAASDDLVTVNGGATVNLIVLKAEHTDRTVVVKHGTGNIWLQGKADISLDDLEDGIMLVWTGTNWIDIAAGGAGGGAGSDTTAIHDDEAGEILGIDQDTAPIGTHELLSENAAGTKKAIPLANLAYGFAPAGITVAAMTLYVDPAGNDGNAGTSGSPLLTIGAALGKIPQLAPHAVTINVAPGTYTEALSTALQAFIAKGTVTIQAVDTADREWWATGTATAGANTTIDIEAADILADDEWNGGYIILTGGTGAGQIRVITDTDDANSRLTVATWDTNPANDTTYILCGMTQLNGNTGNVFTVADVRNVLFQGVLFESASVYSTELNATSVINFTNCIWDTGAYGANLQYGGQAVFTSCGFKVPAAKYGVVLQKFASALFVACVMYGAKSTDKGLVLTSMAYVAMSGTNHFRHFANAVYAAGGGVVTAGSITYTDNTTNAIPAAATDPAYIADVT